MKYVPDNLLMTLNKGNRYFTHPNNENCPDTNNEKDGELKNLLPISLFPVSDANESCQPMFTFRI